MNAESSSSRPPQTSTLMLSVQHEERPGPRMGIRVDGVVVVFACFLLSSGIAKKQTPPKRGWVIDWRFCDDSLDARDL